MKSNKIYENDFEIRAFISILFQNTLTHCNIKLIKIKRHIRSSSLYDQPGISKGLFYLAQKLPKSHTVSGSPFVPTCFKNQSSF